MLYLQSEGANLDFQACNLNLRKVITHARNLRTKFMRPTYHMVLEWLC